MARLDTITVEEFVKQVSDQFGKLTAEQKTFVSDYYESHTKKNLTMAVRSAIRELESVKGDATLLVLGSDVSNWGARFYTVFDEGEKIFHSMKTDEVYEPCRLKCSRIRINDDKSITPIDITKVEKFEDMTEIANSLPIMELDDVENKSFGLIRGQVTAIQRYNVKDDEGNPKKDEKGNKEKIPIFDKENETVTCGMRYETDDKQITVWFRNVSLKWFHGSITLSDFEDNEDHVALLKRNFKDIDILFVANVFNAGTSDREKQNEDGSKEKIPVLDFGAGGRGILLYLS